MDGSLGMVGAVVVTVTVVESLVVAVIEPDFNEPDLVVVGVVVVVVLFEDIVEGLDPLSIPTPLYSADFMLLAATCTTPPARAPTIAMMNNFFTMSPNR